MRFNQHKPLIVFFLSLFFFGFLQAQQLDQLTNTVFRVQIAAQKSTNLDYYKEVYDLGNLFTEIAPNGYNRVQTGNYTDILSANETAIIARNKGYENAYVVTHKQLLNLPEKGHVFGVQIGCFQKPDFTKFSDFEKNSVFAEITKSGMTRVLLGIYTNREQAEAALTDATTKGFDGFIRLLK